MREQITKTKETILNHAKQIMSLANNSAKRNEAKNIPEFMAMEILLFDY